MKKSAFRITLIVFSIWFVFYMVFFYGLKSTDAIALFPKGMPNQIDFSKPLIKDLTAKKIDDNHVELKLVMDFEGYLDEPLAGLGDYSPDRIDAQVYDLIVSTSPNQSIFAKVDGESNVYLKNYALPADADKNANRWHIFQVFVHVSWPKVTVPIGVFYQPSLVDARKSRSQDPGIGAVRVYGLDFNYGERISAGDRKLYDCKKDAIDRQVLIVQKEMAELFMQIYAISATFDLPIRFDIDNPDTILEDAWNQIENTFVTVAAGDRLDRGREMKIKAKNKAAKLGEEIGKLKQIIWDEIEIQEELKVKNGEIKDLVEDQDKVREMCLKGYIEYYKWALRFKEVGEKINQQAGSEFEPNDCKFDFFGNQTINNVMCSFYKLIGGAAISFANMSIDFFYKQLTGAASSPFLDSTNSE